MTKAMTIKPAPTEIEKVLMTGDLAGFTPEQRVVYHNHVCESLGLNPITRPFDYIKLNGKLMLYAKKDATEQLRKVNNVSVVITDRKIDNGVYVVTAKASMPNGRTDESVGAVSIGGLKGDNLANAYMKAETKAKRRVTLSICGLGLLDESEAQDLPSTIRDVEQPKPQTDAKPALPPSVLTKEDMQQLNSLIAESGFSVDDVKQECSARWGVNSAVKLTKAQFTELCSLLAAGGALPEDDIEDAQVSE